MSNTDSPGKTAEFVLHFLYMLQVFFQATVISVSVRVAWCLRLSHVGDGPDFSMNFLGLMRNSVTKTGKISRGGVQFFAFVIIVL